MIITQILYYLCMERPIRISYIQRFMEENGHNVSHSTIIHGYKKKYDISDEDAETMYNLNIEMRAMRREVKNYSSNPEYRKMKLKKANIMYGALL